MPSVLFHSMFLKIRRLCSHNTFHLYFLASLLGFPGGSDSKTSACNAGDWGSFSESERSPGRGHGNPLQYSCLENPMDREAWLATVHGMAKSQTRLSRQAQHRTAQCIYRLSLVAWTVENLPALKETWVQSLGGEDLLEKEMATHSSILA